jgi:uncharacterized membrane protein YvbJ
MLCRSCGTEIADRALICYRCGTATTEAKFKAPGLKVRRSRRARALVAVLAVVLLLVLLAFFLLHSTAL